jgi:U3 small nucleolar ribonucleoprotein protein LCP5
LDAESDDEEPEFDAKDGRAPKDNGDGDGGDGIYRPPKLAPVPYNESSLRKDKSKERRRPVPAALASLAHLDPSRPYAEGTSGLGAAPAANMEMATGRMKDLKRMTEFEEENFTRLIMKKKDARQRLRDEADIALGGVPTMAKAGRRRGGLEDEFADVLRSVGRSTKGATGDGYEELRQKGRKQGALERSRKRGVEEEVAEGPKIRKKSRFDREAKAMKKRTNTRRK